MTLQKRNVEVVDLNDIGKQVPSTFFSQLIDTLNNSEVSWGTNDDTLVRADNFVGLIEEALEDAVVDNGNDWNDNVDVQATIAELKNLGDNVYVSLGH